MDKKGRDPRHLKVCLPFQVVSVVTYRSASCRDCTLGFEFLIQYASSPRMHFGLRTSGMSVPMGEISITKNETERALISRIVGNTLRHGHETGIGDARHGQEFQSVY